MDQLHYRAFRTNFAGIRTFICSPLTPYRMSPIAAPGRWGRQISHLGGDTLGSQFKSRLVSRNVTVDGHRTSLRLEQDVWDALEEVCNREGLSLHEVCTHVERRRSGSSRTAAVRAFVLGYFREAASDSGHVRAGHGNMGVAEDGAKPRLGVL